VLDNALVHFGSHPSRGELRGEDLWATVEKNKVRPPSIIMS
jgi:hypothetical protein